MGIRGRGLMFAVDIKNKTITNTIFNDLLKNGYIVGNRGSFFRIDPPLTINRYPIA